MTFDNTAAREAVQAEPCQNTAANGGNPSCNAGWTPKHPSTVSDLSPKNGEKPQPWTPAHHAKVNKTKPVRLLELGEGPHGKNARFEFPEGWQRTIDLPTQADGFHPLFNDLSTQDGAALRRHVLQPVVTGPDGKRILAGAPGQGKTTIALAMAATVTIGGYWPDGTRAQKGNILIWSGEDDPADTLLPRLLAAGADRNRCYFVTGARRDGEVVPFDPARDLNQLLARIEEIGGVRLLIVDPVVSAVTGDSHKNTEVRRALQPLVDLAAACDCAVLGITHFSKGGQGTDPAQRVVGSVAFTAVARVVLVAAKVRDEQGEDARILARGKSNIGPDNGGFHYHLEQCEPLPGIQASRIAWGKAVEGSARDLLTDPDEDGQDKAEATAKDVATEFLVEILKDGSAPSKYVETEAKAAGISWITVRRASDALGVRKRKMNDAWYWFRPAAPAGQLAQDAHVPGVEQVEQVHEQVAQKPNLLIQDAHVAQSPNHEHLEQVEQVASQPKEVL